MREIHSPSAIYFLQVWVVPHPSAAEMSRSCENMLPRRPWKWGYSWIETKGNEGERYRDIRHFLNQTYWLVLVFLEGFNPWLLESIHLSTVFHWPIWQFCVWFCNRIPLGSSKKFCVENTQLGLKTRVFPLDLNLIDLGAETMVESWLALWRLVFFCSDEVGVVKVGTLPCAKSQAANRKKSVLHGHVGVLWKGQGSIGFNKQALRPIEICGSKILEFERDFDV